MAQGGGEIGGMMALKERDMLHLKSELYDETLAQTYGKPMVRELFNALSAAQEEIKVLKSCIEKWKLEESLWNKRFAILEHQNQKFREALEKIANFQRWEKRDTVKLGIQVDDTVNIAKQALETDNIK